MSIRNLAFALVLFCLVQARPARADVGLGLFLGRPTGFDAKLGLSHNSGLDILLGWDYLDNHSDYAHLTYLLTPVVARGSSVLVPLRFGFGLAMFDDYYYARRYFDTLGV